MSARAGDTDHVVPEDPLACVMHWPLAEVEPRSALSDVAEALAAGGVGAVVVHAGGRLVGMVSERDLVAHLAVGSDLSHLTAGEVMTTEVVTAQHDDSIVSAARLMCDSGVRHLPVLKDQRVAGIVSMRDLLGVFVDDCGRDHVPAADGQHGVVVRPPWAG